MRLLLLLLILPALLSALSVINVIKTRPKREFPEDALQMLTADEPPPDLTQDLTTWKEFVPFYVNLFKDAIVKKTRESYLLHMQYVDLEMLFMECFAVQYENYAAFGNWFQQFVTYHSDPKVEIESQRSTGNNQGEMILWVEVGAQYKYRTSFRMKVSALNDDKIGWKVLLVDRTLDCK